MNNQTKNSAILKEILESIKELKTDVKGLKEDVKGLKEDVKGLKEDVSGIRHDLDDLTKNYRDYTDKESRFQEVRNTNFIVNLLRYNNAAPNIIPININKFYNIDNSDITNFDGCVYVNSVIKGNITMKSRLLNRAISFTPKNNININSPMFKMNDLIIIESKHSGNKLKVDTKIRQMFTIYNLLKSVPSMDLEKVNPSFRTFITYFLNLCKITMNELPLNINLIFSSDDISMYLKDYIININNGITKEQYLVHSSNLFKNDTYVAKIIKYISERNNKIEGLSSESKRKIFDAYFKNSSPNISEIIELFKEVPNKYKNADITMYFTPYEKLDKYFKFIKGSIGVCQFNKGIFPKFFPVDSLNSL